MINTYFYGTCLNLNCRFIPDNIPKACTKLENYHITIAVIIIAGPDDPKSSEEADEEAPHDNFRLTAHSGAGGSRCHTFRHISSIVLVQSVKIGTKLSKG